MNVGLKPSYECCGMRGMVGFFEDIWESVFIFGSRLVYFSFILFGTVFILFLFKLIRVTFYVSSYRFLGALMSRFSLFLF